MVAHNVEKHVLCMGYQAWGHTRPLVQLSARLVKLHTLYVTLFTMDTFFDRVLDELTRSFDAGEEMYSRRVRVLSLGDSPMLSSEVVDENFRGAWKKLMAGEQLQCVKTGKIHNSLPPPDAAIMDFFAVSPIATIKGTSGNLIKVYIWYPAMTAAAFMMFGPERYDGPGCVRIRAEEEAKKTGRPLQEVTYDLLFTPKGKVLSYPGLPLITDYEMHPQDFPVPPEVAYHIFPRLHEIVESSDGMLLTSPASYEPEAVEAVSTWLGETGRPVYICGPLLPAGSKAVSNEKKQSRQGADITAFLDQTLQTSGERSLLYISFGSVFWPLRTPEKLWAFLDVVMELGIPFLLSHASPFAGDLPEEIVKKVKVYGKGFLSVWTPQQSVLQHPATGWFVTHCGHNSIIESISAGVPIIAWPFHADQGFNAIRVSEVLKVGYELIEVRTGHGLHPLYRNGREPAGTSEALRTEAKEVLANAFGEDGTRKREKLLMLTRSFQHEWDEGGRAWNDVHAFLDRL